MKHATGRAYTHGCRCVPCVRYHRKRIAAYRLKRIERFAAEGPKPQAEHGWYLYRWGCRCDVCTTDARTRQAGWKAGRVAAMAGGPTEPPVEDRSVWDWIESEPIPIESGPPRILIDSRLTYDRSLTHMPM